MSIMALREAGLFKILDTRSSAMIHSCHVPPYARGVMVFLDKGKTSPFGVWAEKAWGASLKLNVAHQEL